MMMSMQRESNELVFRLCMRVEVIIPVDQTSTAFPIACIFDDFRGSIAERIDERGELLVGRVGKFFSVEGGQKWEMGLHAKADYDDITVGEVEAIDFFQVCKVGERGGERAGGHSRWH